ncbi:MAG: M20/M25/M40 family metallo-hydrolase [Actinobacteria bacterium]|nr:M20/M25/M40 family metallo-hydrolase [Actinomycetota bacterium]
MGLRDEVTELARALIRVDTSNPPGNETKAAEVLQEYLAGSGVEAGLYARVPERANLVARLAGGDGPALALLCHTDTVLADPREWSRDPWGGELVDGVVWGRGALDMKGHVAAATVALASLAREGFRPAGDLILVAAADEEVGDGFGLEWLVEEHPAAVRADYALNEGGGERVVLGGGAFYLCATAEKMSAPFTLRVRGRSGHASQPAIADNALVKAARLVQALAEHRPEPELGPEVAAFLRAVLGEEPPAAEALARARALDPVAAEIVEPLLSYTLAPTMIEASQKRNVIPALCEVTVDCRIPAGKGPTDVEPAIRAVLGEDGYELEWIERWGGTRSPMTSPLWDAIVGFVERAEPGARVAPVCCAGFTDSHWLRAAFGTVAYGFFPARALDAALAARLIHSADERVPVDDLELGVNFLRHAAQALAG